MKIVRMLSASLACVVAAGCALHGPDPMKVRKVSGTWCSLGTSISWYNDNVSVAGGRFTRGYQDRVMDILKFDGFVNAALNGSTIAAQAAADLPKADYYTIELGINDWGHSTPIGTIEEYRAAAKTRTFYASYRKLIDRIRSKNANAMIILCTPRKGYGFGKYLPSSSGEAKNGIYLREYAEAVRTIAAEEGFVVADFYANCGEDDELESLSIDVALHPNDIGFQLMANELLKSFARCD